MHMIVLINGVEIGGGSIRIHEEGLQKKMFQILGFTDAEAESQFGFLMHAFRYGAPPHGGIAFGSGPAGFAYLPVKIRSVMLSLFRKIMLAAM